MFLIISYNVPILSYDFRCFSYDFPITSLVRHPGMFAIGPGEEIMYPQALGASRVALKCHPISHVSKAAKKYKHWS